MEKVKDYLSKYLFDWDLLQTVIEGQSVLDSKFFVANMSDQKEVESFLLGYGLDSSEPISRAELFGNFQEAIQFIKRYFLKEGNPEGIDLKMPNSIYMIADVTDLFLMATGANEESVTDEERLWAEAILKVMHTILHVDKDIRSSYFKTIQTQIFDKFYKYIAREGDDVFLVDEESGKKIRLVEFETKSKKTRASVIIKLLHKAENVAEELFDRIGVRFVTESKFDLIRVVSFLIEKNIVIPHNIKPSRSLNTILDLKKFKEVHASTLKNSLRSNSSEEEFLESISKAAEESVQENILEEENINDHTKKSYRSVQFTCRQLIKYTNPFFSNFNELRKMSKELEEENELAKKVLSLDISLISKDIRFFYPYEIQVVDRHSHLINTEGEASHNEYKKSQVRSAANRVFSSLLKYKGITLE